MRNIWNLPEDQLAPADVAVAARSVEYLVQRGVSRSEATSLVAREFRLDSRGDVRLRA